MPSNPAYSDDDMVSILVAADLAEVHPNTLRRWVSDGRIPSYRTPGNHLRFRVRDVRAENLIKPATPGGSAAAS